MKNITQLLLTVLPWLLFLLTPKGFCYQRVNCQWGSFGGWSECDPCTKLQTRSRIIAVYAQFGGHSCSGGRTETRSCETTQGCPLEDGCGNRFRCRSGRCISHSLACDGDKDCEEYDDERDCEIHRTSHPICFHGTSPLPPQIELPGQGFDVISETPRATVINTKSLGARCHLMVRGANFTFYRVPISFLHFSFMFKVQNNFSDEMFSSKWHYAKDIVNRQTASGTTSGYHNYDFHESEERTQTHKLLVLKSEIEVGQFQSNSPQYIPISEEFWRALVRLPTNYDYASYRRILERFGTHYLSEGSLGGSLKAIIRINKKTERYMSRQSYSHHECERTKYWALFIPIHAFTKDTCSSGSDGSSSSRSRPRGSSLAKVIVEGGDVEQANLLKGMQLSDPSRNAILYSNWADSVRTFPKVIKPKLRPLSELVKEVQCVGVKRLYLRRAIEQYIAESDACHCQPCRNNGMVYMQGDRCTCICKPGTAGPACQWGTIVEGQQASHQSLGWKQHAKASLVLSKGVIDGRWTCWSAWSSCSGNQRSRHRSCSNPSPQNGGQNCIGQSSETSECEDQELEYFKSIEPHCFDQTLSPPPQCAAPPALINGYILDPKDIYLVGSKVRYSCGDDSILVGHSTLECTANQAWSGRPGICLSSVCKLRSLADDVEVHTLSERYIRRGIGLSCPEGRQLIGESLILCDPVSLNFLPDPANTRCSSPVVPQVVAPLVQCKPWEKFSGGTCVCKMLSECSSSLEVCATSSAGRKSVILTVCKMHVLQCRRKRNRIILEDSNCRWPERNTYSCTNCLMWEICDYQTNRCRCRDSADCSNPGINVCVRVGEDATAANQTMSECEAGLQRCKGEKVLVVSILPCSD